MKFFLACLLIAGVAIAEPEPQWYTYQNPYQPQQQQYGWPQPQSDQYFRAAPASSIEHSPPQQEGRFFFTTLTVTLFTASSTTTTTSTTTCTLSTSVLSVCTVSGRRRRGINLERVGKDLFYNEKEDENEEDSIFLPVPK